MKRILLPIASLVLIALIAVSIFSQEQAQPSVTDTYVVTILPYVPEPTATVNPEQLVEAWKLLDSLKIDLCGSGYVIGSVANYQQAELDAQKYYQELLTQQQADPSALYARHNVQTILKVGLVTCKVVPMLASIFEATPEAQ